MIFFVPVVVKYMKKEPRHNETSLQRTNFASLLALCYIEVLLSLQIPEILKYTN